MANLRGGMVEIEHGENREMGNRKSEGVEEIEKMGKLDKIREMGK